MCSIFYPGEIFLENASYYRMITLHTRRSVCVLPKMYYRGTPRARTRAKVVLSCSTFSNADHCYCDVTCGRFKHRVMRGTEWFCGVQLGGVKLPAAFPAARNSKSMVHAGTDRWRQASAGKMAAPCKLWEDGRSSM